MGLDTSIYNALMAPQKSAFDYAAEFKDRAAQEEDRAIRRQRNALEMQSYRDQQAEKQRGLSEKNALADFYRQGVPDLSNPETQAKLYQVAPSLADSVLKTHGEMAERAAKTKNQEADTIKAQAESEKIKLATSYMMRDRHLQSLGGVQDLNTAAQWIQQGVQLGEFKPEQAQQILGALQSGKMPLEQWKVNAQKGGMTIQQQAQARIQEIEAAEKARHNRASEGLTARGQNMTDARARERLNIDRGQVTAEMGGSADQVALSKRYGKAQPGYRWKPDGSLEAIPGGPADTKAGAEAEKTNARRAQQTAQANSVLQTVDEARNLVGVTTTGIGGVTRSIPATSGRDLSAKLETIKANLGFDRLQQMREASPTGGALGGVAIQELTALQSTVASLDQLQSPAEVRRALDKISTHYRNWARTLEGNSTGQAAPQAQPAKPANKPSVSNW